MKDNLLEFKATVMSAITTGVSYMLPFVVAGGILVAISFAIGGYDVGSAVEPCKTLASTLYYLGQIGLSTLMVPILGAFVAYSIADKPGICVGMYAGWIATDPWSIGYASGFLGALIGGIIAGYLVEALKKMPAKILKITAAHVNHSSAWMRNDRTFNALCTGRTAGSLNDCINTFS